MFTETKLQDQNVMFFLVLRNTIMFKDNKKHPEYSKHILCTISEHNSSLIEDVRHLSKNKNKRNRLRH